MGALFVARAWWCAPGARARLAGGRGRLLRSVPLGHGFWLCVLGITRVTVGVSPGAPICRRFVGLLRDACDLVGQLASGVHVFQSFLVARAFCFCGFALCLLLAPNTREAH